MKKRLFFLLMPLLIVGLNSFVISPSSFEHSNLAIKITDVRSTTGNFILGFYKDSKSFKKRQPFKWDKVAKKDMQNGVLVFKTALPPGTYGIALLDDENNNGKVDYGFFLPIEGFGFSGYIHRGMSIPTFKDFDFQHISADKEVVIKVKYI
jgi:uncharacterized protein (DUF2141 family)